MNWTKQYIKYCELDSIKNRQEKHLQTEKLLKGCRANLPKKNSPEWDWFIDALNNNEKKWFVLEIIQKLHPIPEKLFSPLIRAAVNESCVSNNKFFLRPLKDEFPLERIIIEILSYLDPKDLKSARGVAPILYWAACPEALASKLMSTYSR